MVTVGADLTFGVIFLPENTNEKALFRFDDINLFYLIIEVTTLMAQNDKQSNFK